jgi:hypothetical protein
LFQTHLKAAPSIPGLVDDDLTLPPSMVWASSLCSFSLFVISQFSADAGKTLVVPQSIKDDAGKLLWADIPAVFLPPVFCRNEGDLYF